MTKPLNKELIFDVKKYHSQGLSDGKISKILGKPQSQVHYYRLYVLKLPAHQPRRFYNDDETRLKGYILRGVKFSAKRRGIPFDLKIDDIIIVDKCPLLGVDLIYKDFSPNKTDFNNLNYATVDRKDSTKGYTKDNIWIISRLANNMKNCATPDQLKTFCENMTKNMI